MDEGIFRDHSGLGIIFCSNLPSYNNPQVHEHKEIDSPQKEDGPWISIAKPKIFQWEFKDRLKYYKDW